MTSKLNKNLLQYLANKSITGLKCDISGVCSYSGELITEEFVKNGFNEFYIVEGYVRIPGWTGRTTHTWIELYDESIIDPVFDQFPNGTERLDSFQVKYTPEKYLSKIKKQPLAENNLKRFTPLLDNALKNFFTLLTEAGNSKKDVPPPDMEPPSEDGPPDAGGPPDMGGPPGGGGPSGGDGPPDDGGGAGGEDDKNKITNYNEKLKSAKVIKFQRNTPEPEYEFQFNNEMYKNYVGKTKNGSIILPIKYNIKFLNSMVIPKIEDVIKNALAQKKRVVLLSNNGMPYYKGKYNIDAAGKISKYLNEKYGSKYVIYDTWIPTDYYAFVSNDETWEDVKERTQVREVEMKAALYLYLLTTISGRKFANKLKTKNVLKILESWGITEDVVSIFNLKNINKIASVVYPDVFGREESMAGFIIKTYLQVLRVNMIKKVFKYEKEGKIVIVLSDKNTAWSLKPTFDKFDEIKSGKGEKDSSEDGGNDVPSEGPGGQGGPGEAGAPGAPAEGPDMTPGAPPEEPGAPPDDSKENSSEKEPSKKKLSERQI